MRRDLGQLEIEHLIVHKVPQRLTRKVEKQEKDKDNPLLPQVEHSDVESPLTVVTRNYFTERIQDSLRAQRMYVTFDLSHETPVVCEAVFHFLNDPSPDFVERSKQIADHLYDSQNATNSGGLVLVAQARIEEVPAVAILKLEEESAIHFQRETHEGKSTFTLTHLGDLTMTKNTKVFKAALFVREGDNVEEIEGQISDNQLGPREETGVAEFFLRKFLGCQQRDDPAALLARSYEAAVSWIYRNEALDPAKKADYLEAIRVDLKNNRPTWDIEQTAQENMAAEDSDDFLSYLVGQGLPSRELPKDMSIVASRLKASTWEFASGIRVSYPVGTFREHISVEEAENGDTVLTIVDTTKRVK